jgi:5'-nucleotidase
MFAVRTFRMPAVAVASVVAIGTFGAAPALAARPAPAPTNLQGSAVGHVDGTYAVSASWDAVAKATSYRVSLTKSGTTLTTATVPSTIWAATVTTTPGTASLSVRAVVGHKPGKAATVPVALDDVTPPTGGFHASFAGGIATIAVTTAVADNGGGPVTATVNWDDGSLPEPWDLVTDITHPYPATAHRYVPVVTLTDSSANSNPVTVNAVVVDDTEAPTGAFSVSTTAAWASYSQVTLTQTDLGDNWTPPAQITRSVDWGDGSGPVTWTAGSTLSHTFASGGDFTPTVTLTDEAGNTTDPAISTTAVHVSVDSTAPGLKLTLPTARHSVKAWKRLRGTATDTETGVKSVRLKAVEKRSGSWFGYRATTQTWVKAASKARAFSKAKAFSLTTNDQHQWVAKLVRLRQGRLVYKVRATDHVSNRSATLTHRARLTRA